MKILVTGGAGFIGSHLVDKLLEDGHNVKVLDNLHTGDIENVKRHNDSSSFQFLEGDVRNRKVIREAVQGVQAVFHEAAITSVPASVENPDLTREVNLEGTENLLDESLSEGVEKFIFASTCAIYGEAEKLPISENSKTKPDSPYAESKLKAENKVKNIQEKNGLDTVIFRYFNVYGPRQKGGRYAGVINKFLERLTNNQPPIIYGDGEQTRDFIYIKDIVKANMLGLEKKEISGEEFNVGTGKAVTINRLCNILLDLMGKTELEPVYRETRPGDIRHSMADLSKVSKDLGFRPEFSLEEGLRLLIQYRS